MIIRKLAQEKNWACPKAESRCYTMRTKVRQVTREVKNAEDWEFPWGTERPSRTI